MFMTSETLDKIDSISIYPHLRKFSFYRLLVHKPLMPVNLVAVGIIEYLGGNQSNPVLSGRLAFVSEIDYLHNCSAFIFQFELIQYGLHFFARNTGALSQVNQHG